jgi:hypothetical protein
VPSQQVVIIACFVGAVILLDSVIFWALLRSGWSELVQGFSGAEVSAGAVRRDFQSFKVGLYSFGWCVHVAVDEHHLHVFPAALLRWVGATRASIPWERVRVVKVGKRSTRVQIGMTTVTGPTWCLSMAVERDGAASG